jgi:phosphatase NudJ
MAREPSPTWFFALVVVRRGHRFLLVHERKHGGGWFLPAGRVEPGETLAQAAVRETLEEAGVPIVLEGVLRVEHEPSPHSARVRVFFVARPADDTPPKQHADEHSQGAAWVSLDELAAHPLRGDEVREVLEAVSRGAVVAPLSLLTSEGAPW